MRTSAREDELDVEDCEERICCVSMSMSASVVEVTELLEAAGSLTPSSSSSSSGDSLHWFLLTDAGVALLAAAAALALAARSSRASLRAFARRRTSDSCCDSGVARISESRGEGLGLGRPRAKGVRAERGVRVCERVGEGRFKKEGVRSVRPWDAGTALADVWVASAGDARAAASSSLRACSARRLRCARLRLHHMASPPIPASPVAPAASSTGGDRHHAGREEVRDNRDETADEEDAAVEEDAGTPPPVGAAPSAMSPDARGACG